ncbi:hypothetical protein [Yinghuangia soli]|uniref:DUF4034 domain-containing protein n=1 Tax=Yinghuangia soli TaxID=2908204 RepID=A0AA41PVJ3_9ACTN|nr:hypothetical protein [Yinghuangia soli]MCF2526645.1 hypothetical protein [Yinghuangia soli]
MSLSERFRRPERHPYPMPAVVDLATADADIAAMCDHVRTTGDWRAAAAFLESMPLGRPDQVDRRDLASTALSALAQASPGWFAGWETAEPRSAFVLSIRADLWVAKAWKVRGSGYASTVSPAAFREFSRILESADAAARAAVEADPQSGDAWMTWMQVGMGQGVGRAEFDRRWQGLTAAAPHHRFGHNVALQIKCEKWYGSHDEMFAFARTAAAAAPAGSPLKLLPVQAHVEYVLRAARDESFSRGTYWNSAEVRPEVLAAQAAWEARPAPGPTDLHEYSLLAYAQAQSGRWRETGALFTAAGHRVVRYPWSYMPSTYLGIVHGLVEQDRKS